MHLNVHRSIIYNAKIQKQYVSINRQMDKDDAVTHAMEYHPAIKKNEILQFATTWMYLEDIMLSDVTQRKTDILRSLI